MIDTLSRARPGVAALAAALLFSGCLHGAGHEKKVVGEAPQGLPFSPAIQVGNTLYIAGTLGTDPATGQLVGDSAADQTRQILTLWRNLLDESGFDYDDIVRVTVYLTDFGDYAAMNDAYTKFFDNEFPARAALEVSGLAFGAKVEMTAIAVKTRE